ILEMLERNDLNKGHTYQQQLGSLANLYITMKRYNEALQLYDRQIEIYKSINSNFRTAYYYESILIEKGQALAGLKRVQESAEIFEEVLNFFERNDADRAVLSNVYLYKGMSELLAEQYQNGLQSLNKTLAIQRANDRARTTDAVPTYSNIAEVYAGLKQFDKAVTYMDSALWINQFNSEFHPDSVGRVGILRWQIEMYNDKLEILKQGWEHEKDNSMLDLAFDVIERGNLTLDYTRKVLVSDESKLRIAEDFYQYAVYFNLQKYNLTNADEYLWKALSFTENNKSFLLNSLTSQRQISKDSEYHKLLDQREEYKQVMSSYAAQDDINNQYIFYAKLDSIQSKVDEFADYKHYREINKEWLSAQFPEASILSAHVSFNSVDFFLVNDAGLNFKQIEIDSAFASDVIALRKSYSSPESKALRLSWFDPLMEWLEPQLSNRLIIIPDGILNYLPFELLTHSASQEQFLLEKTNITYLNYIAQPLRNTSGGRSRANDMISYAPEFYSQSTLASADVVRGDLAGLPGAIEEATLVKDLFKGESFTKQQATETAFKKTSQEIGLIHLATHAIIDDANPNLSRLVFSLENDSLNDGYLHAYEISNLELEAQLVTLSACNTGFGKIKKGEGVMSLSRSFAYAGVPATIVSLWPASDKSTPELMKYFYQNLKDGQAKDVALNNARKQYLETATGKARHPFYWGGFVLIGDNRPLEAPQNNMIWILLLFTAVIVTATVVRRRRQ
ncbi:MAG: CHAT domain-containing tetratricopeptide repeat protein, partial [Cyclobacteriaceae bacterium]